MSDCQVDECERPVKTRGMCHAHYERERRNGRLVLISKDPLVRLWGRIDKQPGGCWLWTGALSTSGYGRTQWGGRMQQAHRVIYELLVGPIPGGLDIDHLCRVRACVNPEHLEPVTRQVNLIRGIGAPAVNASKTHCTSGHEFTPANTYTPPGTEDRACRECRRKTIAARAAREKIERRSSVRDATCVVCDKPFQYVRSAGRHLICSDECRKQRSRQISRDFQRAKRARA